MMDDVYVRKDTFEETMKRIEAMMAASEARTTAQIAEIRAEVQVYRADSRRESESLASDIRAIKDRLDSMDNRAARWQGILGLVFGLCAVIVAGVQVYLAVKAG